MTKKVYLDANVLIAHQAKGHKYYSQAKKLIEKLWKGKTLFYISSLTVDEFLYGISVGLRVKAGDLPYSQFTPQLGSVLKNILSWENVHLVSFENTVENLHGVLKNITEYNLRPRDAFHLRIMEQVKITNLATFDHDFDAVQEAGRVKIRS